MCELVWIHDHVHDENTKVKINAKTPREHRHTMDLRESELCIEWITTTIRSALTSLLINVNLTEDVTIFSNIMKRNLSPGLVTLIRETQASHKWGQTSPLPTSSKLAATTHNLESSSSRSKLAICNIHEAFHHPITTYAAHISPSSSYDGSRESCRVPRSMAGPVPRTYSSHGPPYMLL